MIAEDLVLQVLVVCDGYIGQDGVAGCIGHSLHGLQQLVEEKKKHIRKRNHNSKSFNWFWFILVKFDMFAMKGLDADQYQQKQRWMVRVGL